MDLFHVSEEVKEDVRKIFQTNKQEVEKKVNNVLQWVNTQPHLPPNAKDTIFLETTLLRCKFNEEKTKLLIESYFEYIGRFPEYFENLVNVQPTQEAIEVILYPKLTQNLERIIVLKLSSTSHLEIDAHRTALAIIASAFIILNMDYRAGIRFLVDYENFTFAQFSKFTPTMLLKCLTLYQKVLKTVITGIEIINAPSFISAILNLGRAILPPKLFSRITVHEDLDSLYENISKKYLSANYGGEVQHTDEILVIWNEVFEHNRPFLEKIRNFSESTKSEINDTFGMQGSFKSLAVD